MTTYSAITASEIDADSPIDVDLASKWTNNLLAIQEGDASAPQIAHQALADITGSASTVLLDADWWEKYSETASSRLSHTDAGVDGSGMVKKWEMICPLPGSYRVLIGITGGAVGTHQARIYRNGTGVGTTRTNNTGSEVQYTENVSGWSKGDLMQIYLLSTNSVTNLNRVYVYADAVPGNMASRAY